MKIVLLKGLEGFGDRLQCLLQAIGYAKATGRILVVDWRDSHWTHDQSLEFEHYFRIEGLKTLSFSSFVSEIEAYSTYGSDRHSVAPEAWCNRLIDPDYETFIRNPDYALPGNGGCLERIIEGREPDFEHSIVVYPGIGLRNFQCRDALHLRPMPLISEALQACVNEHQLSSGQYDIVHLRGGTKSWAGGSISEDSPNYNKHIQWESVHHYMQEIFDVLQQLREGSVPRPLYILTDTPSLAEQWMRCFGEATLISNRAHGLMGDTGIHKIHRQSLSDANWPESTTGSSPPITKELLNVEAIRDFILMNNARHLVGDGISVFSYLAYGLKSNNVVLADLPARQPTPQASQHGASSHGRWLF
jgi:hypothetical protein